MRAAYLALGLAIGLLLAPLVVFAQPSFPPAGLTPATLAVR